MRSLRNLYVKHILCQDHSHRFGGLPAGSERKGQRQSLCQRRPLQHTILYLFSGKQCRDDNRNDTCLFERLGILYLPVYYPLRQGEPADDMHRDLHSVSVPSTTQPLFLFRQGATALVMI